MTRQEKFKQQYITDSNMSNDEFDNNYVVLPCNCGCDDKLAVVSINRLNIMAHLNIYM